MKQIFLFILLFIMMFTGCEKPGPIELVDDETPPRSIEIDTTAELQEYLTAGNPEIDSSGYFLTSGGRALGMIMVGGARFDAGIEGHEASVAQAFFFNVSQPVIYLGDTIAFTVMNAGDIRVNDLLLGRYQRRLTLPGISLLDTLLGYQYGLYRKDGIGGRGFEYEGNRLYRWNGQGTTGFPAFSETLRTPYKIQVALPQPNAIVERTKALKVQILGNADEITIFIRPKPLSTSGLEAKPLLKLKAKKQGNGITIPSAVLRLLPRDATSFLFSFQVERNRLTHINGFSGDVFLNASYVLHIVLRVTR